MSASLDGAVRPAIESPQILKLEVVFIFQEEASLSERSEAETVLQHGATEKLAGSEPCSVYRCACGCLHVHIGAVTLRLHADTFQQLAGVFSDASRALGSAVPSLHRH
jgi:hypothetical protein